VTTMDRTERNNDFDALFHSGYARLVGQLTAYLGDATEAEDVAQEAFLRAWQRWEKVSRYDDPVAWVHRVAWNLATSRWRRVAMAARVLRGQRAPEPIPALDADRVALVAALRSLPEQQRQAVVRHYLGDHPVADIAADLGVPRGTVLSWLHRARAALATRLADAPTPAVTPPPVRTIARRAARRRTGTVGAVVAALAAAAAILVVGPLTPPPVASIVDVDWTDTAITLPARADRLGCPTGALRVAPAGDGSGQVTAGGRTLTLHPEGRVAGDLTNEGPTEVALQAQCTAGPPASRWAGGFLLVATAGAGGTPAALGYAGPQGSTYSDVRVQPGVLTAKALFDGGTTLSPAQRITTWSRFGEAAWRGDRVGPLVLAPADGSAGAAMDLPVITHDGGAVACPGGGVVAFAGRRAQAHGVTYELVDAAPVDVDGEGDDELVAEVRCSATGASSLFLLVQGVGGFVLGDVPVADDGGVGLREWELRGTTLAVTIGDGEVRELRFANGRYAPPVGTWTR
jgi:RNA polymerase sigma-70 factor (ECF subfamily)